MHNQRTELQSIYRLQSKNNENPIKKVDQLALKQKTK